LSGHLMESRLSHYGFNQSINQSINTHSPCCVSTSPAPRVANPTKYTRLDPRATTQRKNTVTKSNTKKWASKKFYIYSDMHTCYSNASPPTHEATCRFTLHIYRYNVIHLHACLPPLSSPFNNDSPITSRAPRRGPSPPSQHSSCAAPRPPQPSSSQPPSRAGPSCGSQCPLACCR
jgi:hypothetical protein